MICPNCRIEFDGDRCPSCGMSIKDARRQSTESGPEMVSTGLALRLAWEALKTMYFVVGLIVVAILLIVGLILLVSWCVGP